MAAKKQKKIEHGVIVDCKEADALDLPEDGAPIVCQLSAGRRVLILSKPNKRYYGIGISPSVVGFVRKEFVKAE